MFTIDIFTGLDFTDETEAPAAPADKAEWFIAESAWLLLDEAIASIDWSEEQDTNDMTDNVLSPARCVLTPTLSTPSKVTTPQTVSDARVRYMKKCREVNRLKAFPVKKDLVFPSNAARNYTGTNKSIQAEINSHMISYGLAWLNAQDSESIQNGTPHVAERLVDALAEHYETQGRHLLYSASDGFQGAKSRVPGVAWEELYDRCIEWAAYVYDRWDPKFPTKLSAWGAKGGKKSKRGPKIGRPDYESVAHLPLPEQAKALGVSYRTVSRYRKDAAA